MLNSIHSNDYDPNLNLLGMPFPKDGIPAIAFSKVLAEGEFIETWVEARKDEGANLYIIPASLNSCKPGVQTAVIDREHSGVGMALVVVCEDNNGSKSYYYTSGISADACRRFARKWGIGWSPA